MSDNDWRGSVEEEKRELDKKITKLENFLKLLTGLPPHHMVLLNKQLSYMKLYSTVLAQRLQEAK